MFHVIIHLDEERRARMKNKEKIKYTLKHKAAFLQVEKELLGKNTIRGYLHDLDKVILYLFLPYSTVKHIHKRYSRHHGMAKTHADYVQKLIDWECARYSKDDKQMSAREYIKVRPELKEIMLPILEEFGL